MKSVFGQKAHSGICLGFNEEFEMNKNPSQIYQPTKQTKNWDDITVQEGPLGSESQGRRKLQLWFGYRQKERRVMDLEKHMKVKCIIKTSLFKAGFLQPRNSVRGILDWQELVLTKMLQQLMGCHVLVDCQIAKDYSFDVLGLQFKNCELQRKWETELD